MVVQYTSGVGKSVEGDAIPISSYLSRMYNDGTGPDGLVRMAFVVHGLTSKWGLAAAERGRLTGSVGRAGTNTTAQDESRYEGRLAACYNSGVISDQGDGLVLVPDSPNNADQELLDLKSEVVLLRERLALLSGLSREISASLDQPTVLQAVVDAACRLTSARYGALAVFDESGLVLKFVTRGITEEQREGMGTPPVGRGLLGWLQHSQEPLRLSDLGSHPESSGFPPATPR